MQGYIKLRTARLCLDFEKIFEECDTCPACGRDAWIPLKTWVPALKGEDLAIEYEPRIEVPGFWSWIFDWLLSLRPLRALRES